MITNCVRSSRETRKMSLQSLANSAGVSSAHLSQLEKGKRCCSVEVALKISRALDVPVTALFQVALDNAVNDQEDQPCKR